MRLKVLAIVVLLVVAGGAVVAAMGGLTPATTSASTLLTAAAAVTDVTDEIAATGTVEATDQYELAFGRPIRDAAAWPVAEREGGRSATGSRPSGQGRYRQPRDTRRPLDDQISAEVDDATRAFQTAEIQVAQAQAQLDSDDHDRRAPPDADEPVQRGDRGRARKADLAALKALRSSATLTAPAAGVVTAVAIPAGDDAPAGAAITMISSDLRISTSVVESDVASISIGQEATVSVAALNAASIDGTVASIAPAASSGGNSGVVSFAVKVELDSPPTGLRPGMSADITIVAASATSVSSRSRLGPWPAPPAPTASASSRPTARSPLGRSRSGSSRARSPRSSPACRPASWS